jgi:hypothetical protein
MRIRGSALAVAVVVGILGCDARPIDVTQAVEMETHTNTQIVGRHDALAFSVVETADRQLSVTFDFGDLVIKTELDNLRGIGSFDGNGPAFTERHQKAILALYRELPAIVPKDDQARTRVEDTLLRQTSYVATARVGEVLPAISATNNQSITYLSCSCSWQGLGNGYAQWAGVGDGCTGNGGNGCKGRCGVGCGWDNTYWSWGSGSYTQDCGRHDYGWAPWSDAFDDYSWGSYNCAF